MRYRYRSGILFLLVLTMLFGLVSIGAGDLPEEEETREPNVRVYFIDVSTNRLSGDCILIESDGHYGLIDAGHRRQNSITDEDGTVYYCSAGAGLSCSYNGKNGDTLANILVKSFNITHLDFILATHSHSDHIGGIPGIVNYEFRDENNEKRHLVDDTTVYFYKQYYHTRPRDDDLPGDGEEADPEADQMDEDSRIYVISEVEETTISSWHSQAFYYQAVQAAKEQGCIMADLSVGVQPGEAGNPAAYDRLIRKISRKGTLGDLHYDEHDPDDLDDDSFSFTFGKVKFWLYNLLPRKTNLNENVNSIVAAMDDGTSVVAFTGDINVEGQAEQKVMAAILNEVGSVDLLKAAHHGAAGYSNSRATFDMHQPEYVVVTSRRDPRALTKGDAFMVARAYAEVKYGTKFYEAGATKWALLAELFDDGIELAAVSGNATHLIREDPETARYTSVAQDGWTMWQNEYPQDDEPSEYEWMYFQDGAPLTGWVSENGELFYLDDDGLRKLGLNEIDGEWYYFWPAHYNSASFASMMTGWLDVAEGLFYFREDGTKVNGWMEDHGLRYYFPEGGPAAVGWQEIDGKWYCFDENGVMLTGWQTISWPGGERRCYLGQDGAMCFGWQEIDGEKYYFRPDGSMATGWEEADGVRAYFRDDGTAAGGLLTLDGERYLLDEQGRIRTGWQSEGGKTCYCREDGVMLTGWQTVDGEDYYFDEDGAMATGWRTLNDKKYYFDEEGHFLTGWKKVELNGRKSLCHFNEQGMLTIHF